MASQEKMKRNKTWILLLACLLVLVVGGVVIFLVPRAPSDREAYDIAVSMLRMQYAGPAKFNVSAYDAIETKIVQNEQGCTVSGLFESDKADLSKYREQSVDGRIRFSLQIVKVSGYPGYRRMSVREFNIGPNR